MPMKIILIRLLLELILAIVNIDTPVDYELAITTIISVKIESMWG